MTEHYDWQQVILRPRLKAAIERLIHYLPLSMLEEQIGRFTGEANKQ